MNECVADAAPLAHRWANLVRGALVAGVLLGGLALAQRYTATRQAVILDINGVRLVHSTHKDSADEVLHELGIHLGASDSARLPNDQDMALGVPIELSIARRIWLSHDGSLTELYTHAASIENVLVATGLAISEHDQIWLGGQRVRANAPLPELVRPRRAGATEWIATIRQPLQLDIRRGIPIEVHEDGIPVGLHTTAATVGEALYEKGILIYLGDRVFPSTEARLTPGMTISITRGRPVTLEADGSVRRMRTHLETVGDLLIAAGVALEPDDYTLPARDAPLESGMHVSVVRVYDEYYVEETPIPFETRWEPNPELEIDQRRTASWGREGAWRQQVRVHYENGQEVHRTEEESWVAREPEDRILEYGTKIVVRQLETEHGTIEYWRKLRMLATSYNAETAGKPPGHPTYGITRLGEVARRGIIAVDPHIIPMRQQMYVPGYGRGYAGDTGSAIKDRRIDLCYDDHNLVLWYRWVDVYLLTPAPPPGQITWIIPNNPRERE